MEMIIIVSLCHRVSARECLFQELDASNKDPVPVIIVGNKVDLADQRCVSYKEGQRVGQLLQMRSFIQQNEILKQIKPQW